MKQQGVSSTLGSYTIQNVCNSTNDAEMRAAHESVMTGVCTAERVEKILFGHGASRTLAELAKNSEPLKKVWHQ